MRDGRAWQHPRAQRLVLAVSAVVAACGQPAPEVVVDTTFSDCAANEQFSAGVVQQAADGRVGPYALLYENTDYLLFAQDGCVWARAGDVWNQVHARRLSQNEKEGLQARVGLETWGSLSGVYQGDGFDGTPYLFFDGRTTGSWHGRISPMGDRTSRSSGAASGTRSPSGMRSRSRPPRAGCRSPDGAGPESPKRS